MLLGFISIENGTQVSKRMTREWITKATFYEYGRWIEQNGVYLTGNIRVREEERDDLTNEMAVSDRRFDPQQDLVFEETETGYRYYLPNEDWKEGFYIRAQEGAEMLKNNYIRYFYGDVADFVDGKYDSDEQKGVELIWRQLYNGDYVLVSKKDGVSEYFSHAGILERTE